MPVLEEDARTSITRSFRFENDVLRVLDEEADRMGISVNALVGTVLRR
jgi:predicted HicB family RNase H-like nuclease